MTVEEEKRLDEDEIELKEIYQLTARFVNAMMGSCLTVRIDRYKPTDRERLAECVAAWAFAFFTAGLIQEPDATICKALGRCACKDIESLHKSLRVLDGDEKGV